MMEKEIRSIFDLQKKHQLVLRQTDAKARILKLQKLKDSLLRYEEQIYTALQHDLRKSRFEAAVTELIFTYGEIDHAIRKLKQWMKPGKVAGTISNLFAKNRIYYEPKGVCLIIAPWNYPLQLIMSPLISAVAAGNCVILKPSELSAATANVIQELIEQNFDPKEIACFTGDASVSKTLLQFPFDHIFFTGSTAIGKIVMEAAAQHLCSVTLELGGKSPVLIDESADLKTAAKKIAWGKLINAGQTCIAPDYVLLPEKEVNNFVQYYREAAEELFMESGNVKEDRYAKIINPQQFRRLEKLLKDAVEQGAKLEWGGACEQDRLTIHPAVLSHVDENNPLMQEEIFGPILPVIGYTSLDDAIRLINGRNKPLALYIFSGNKTVQHRIIMETSAGGTCVNDVLIHISNPNLPFGGVNHSGIGNCHGIYGFRTFSHERAVVFQSRLGLTRLIYPPYHKKMQLLKWLQKLI